MLRRLSWAALLISVVHTSCTYAQAIGQVGSVFSRLDIRHREHKGMGYDKGYSTAALFVSPRVGATGLSFVDGRAHLFNNEDLAANLGVGIRFSDRAQTYLFGLNTYYDYRNIKWLSTHQLSGGIEILSRRMDVRLNGYYPFAGKYQDDPISFHGFKGHHMMVYHKVRYALPCADAELGWTLPDPFDQVGLYLGVGGYYLFKQKGFNREVGNVPGVKARLTANPSSYLSLGAEYTYDRLFRGRANGFIALNIPLGKNRARTVATKAGEGNKITWAAIQTQDVVKNEIIPLARKTHRFPHLQGEGKPLHFVFVNNQKLDSTGVGSGEGTFEDPYTTLALGTESAHGRDVLYVFAGDGSSNGYDEGVLLEQGQQLISSGAEVHVNGVQIPALTPHAFPLLTSQHGPVIQVMGPGVVIQGFRLEGQDDHAVYVEGGGVTLLHNYIRAAPNFSAFKEAGGEKGAVSLEASILQGNVFIGCGGQQNPAVVDLEYSGGKYLLMNNDILATGGQNGITIQDPQGATHLARNRFVSTDPSGTAIEYTINDCELQEKHRCYGNTVSNGFYQAVHIEGEAKAETLFEVHDNEFISETLGMGVVYEHGFLHGGLSVVNNSISSSQEGIWIHDVEEAVSTIEISGNRLYCYSGTPSISSELSGAFDMMIEENQIDYVQNVTGMFSGISSYLKEGNLEQSRLVIMGNQLRMPGDNEEISTINERMETTRVEINGKSVSAELD